MKKEISNGIMKDLMGYAIHDYYVNGGHDMISVFMDGNREEDMSPEIFFRPYARLKGWERHALNLCHGSILDVGSAAGSHSLILQKRGFNVTAIDSSAYSSEVARQRGVQYVLNEDIMELKGIEYNTILLLMNGFGIPGTEHGALKMLKHLKKMLAKGGQIIGDSTDILYAKMNALEAFSGKKYYGEVEFILEYKGIRSTPFQWVYPDQSLLFDLADKAGLKCEIIRRDKDFHYLARLRK